LATLLPVALGVYTLNFADNAVFCSLLSCGVIGIFALTNSDAKNIVDGDVEIDDMGQAIITPRVSQSIYAMKLKKNN
jgi:hypothetical protein